MKTSVRFFICWAILCFHHLQAQNLVQNPSFETEIACPGISILSNFANWRDPWVNMIGDTCSTSDSYRVGGGFLCGGTFVLGATTARTGTRVAGIITYSGFAFAGCTPAFTDNWREYAEGQLTSALVGGQTYCISIWIKLASNVKWATNRMGVYMSNSLVTYGCNTTGSDSHLQSKGIIPQMESPTVVTNTAGWTNLTFSYLATGGEQFITIGNFRNAAGTTRVDNNCGSINTYAYYYLDDISVTLGACAILPIDLLSLEAQCAGNEVEIAWEAANERTYDNPFFVERSIDSENWETVSSVDVSIEPDAATTRYQYRDAVAKAAGKMDAQNYYRIRQTDANGINQYSHTVQTTKQCEPNSDVVVHPNPSKGEFTIGSDAKIQKVRVSNLVGETVFLQENVGDYGFSVDISEFAPGIYYLQVTRNGKEAHLRLIKE